jgi:hypothetical protein
LAICVGDTIGHLHTAYVIDHELTAALWSLLAEVQGVWYLGKTRDRVGRPAVGLAFDGQAGQQHIIYADEATGDFLGTEVILIEDSEVFEAFGLEVPAVMEFQALTEARWINESEVPRRD